MTALIILGNINQYTFANSIKAANEKAQQLFGKPLSNIYVLHSRDSYKTLQKLKFDEATENWSSHLEENGITHELFIERITEITSEKQSIENFVGVIESIIRGLNESNNLILDLTNGTTPSKNLLSIAAYILDVPHQYMIDVGTLFKLTSSKGFLATDILEQSYVPAPDSTKMDTIAYLNLSEMIRYKRIVDDHAHKYTKVNQDDADTRFFKDNLIQSIQLKLSGDKRKDNVVYRIAASSISVSAEDLISRLVEKFIADSGARTFGEKLGVIRNKVEQNAPPSFDIEFFRKFNDFMLHLRNSTTHKAKFLTDLEKFKADLSVKMSFPFIEFYTDIIYDILSEGQLSPPPTRITHLESPEISSEKKMYYGLDGDDTGRVLEELFFSAKRESHFRKVSSSITRAILQVRKNVVDVAGKSSIVFEAGDDLLFKGSFTKKDLETMQGTYNNITSGLTCSIGYGSSFQEVYLALKLAKSRPGKNSIVGIALNYGNE